MLMLMCPALAHAGQTAGVQTHLLWDGVDTPGMERQLDAADAAGAGIVRVDVGWASLEPDAKGQYSSWYLNRIDAVVNQAHARGLKVLFTFWETPCWASTAPDSLKQSCAGAWWDRGVQRYAPSHASDYADALAFLAKRYGSRVAAWEIWNEPNSADYLKAADPVSAYADLVKAAYGPAKAASPSSTIVAGSLMWADFDFADKLFQKGINGHFDAFSIHPYSDDRSPLDPGLDQWMRGSFLRGVPAVHAVQQRYGNDKPLWLTEFGWSTNSTRNSSNWLNGVDDAQQAHFVSQALAQIRSWKYVDVAIYFGLLDTGADKASTIDNFGLMDQDGTAKPAYAAFRTGANALRTASASDASAPSAASAPPLTISVSVTPPASANSTPAATPNAPVTARAKAKAKAKRHQRTRTVAVHTKVRSGSAVRSLHALRTLMGLRVSGRAAPRRRIELRVFRRHASHPLAFVALRAGRHGKFRSSIHKRTLRHRRVLRVVAR
jgi:hypothetical protein